MKDIDQLAVKTKNSIKDWLEEGATLRSQATTRSINATAVALDEWQQQAVDALASGDHVVVDAPTSAGKTRVVEHFFKSHLQDPKFRAVYTTPVKSLSNDKVREFREMFGEKNVGISTGDIKENLHAPIVVATLESYRNSLLGTEPDLGRTIAVFDEYHYMQDEGRGSAWEEAIILSPPQCQLLLLSASVANAEEFVDWIQKIGKRRCLLVRTVTRPVPLTHLIYHGQKWIHADLVPRQHWEKVSGRSKDPTLATEAIVDRLPDLIDLELTPCILYAGKRLTCENLANAITKKLKPIPEEHRRKIGDVLQQMQTEVGVMTFLKPQLRQMIQVYGVAFHHSGLAPPLRMSIEKLVKEGLIRFCVATMGLSLGINFSVRSTMITDFMRPGDQGPQFYAPSDVLQMLGRAGRRGKDVMGFSLWPAPEYFLKMSDARREDCKSKLKQDPTTFLGLIGRGMSTGAMESLYGKSFRKHQDKNFDLRLIQKSHIQNKLNEQNIPCESPSGEIARFWAEDKKSLCFECPFQKKCHSYIEFRSSGMLAVLQIHLHALGAITQDDQLTGFGSCARYFPQTGGMVIAQMIVNNQITEKNLIEAAQLMATMSLARFKEPRTPDNYRLPFSEKTILKQLEEFYPQELFPDMYDEEYRTHRIVFKDFNTRAGYIVREWLKGKSWNDLSNEVANEYFGVGDVMNLIYRTATYLQSVAQLKLPGISEEALKLRAFAMREPLNVTI